MRTHELTTTASRSTPCDTRASHGHNQRVELDDRDIAVHWLTSVSREKVPLAPYKGRPCIPIEEIPPRLYHGTVKDAAFAILSDKLIAGYGASGRGDEQPVGVRNNLPGQVVFETAAGLKYAYLFETSSAGWQLARYFFCPVHCGGWLF